LIKSLTTREATTGTTQPAPPTTATTTVARRIKNLFFYHFSALINMIKLNKKLRSNTHSKGNKVKVPKIEINECKVKTKDHKKLENEMFQQAKEARTLLDKLLVDDQTSNGRIRANSLNATVENLILSTHNVDYNKFLRQRGSVPAIPALYQRQSSNEDEESPSSSISPSPELRRALSGGELDKTSATMKNEEEEFEASGSLYREHSDEPENDVDGETFVQCPSPQLSKRICEPTLDCKTSIVVTMTSPEEADTCSQDVTD